MASTKRKERKAETTNTLKQVKDNKKVTKSQMVMKYMQTHKKGITSMQAFEMFKATRLSSIIFEYRKRGYEIETIKEKTADGTTYARYVLRERA